MIKESIVARQKRLSYHSHYYRTHREKMLKQGKEYYTKSAEYVRQKRLNNKKQVFDHYGWKCACCGETEAKFLSIDHVNNDGHKERKSRGGSSDKIIRNIIKQYFPETYQILCFNCNLGKAQNNGVCPHKSYESNTRK